MKIVLIVIMIGTMVTTLSRPWVGIGAYYLIALLGPQYIWFWLFEGLRVSFWVALFAVASVLVSFFSNKTRTSFLFTKINFYVFCLFVAITISYFFGDYVSQHQPKYGLTPYYIYIATVKICLLYFCAVLVIDDEAKIFYLSCVIAIVTIYMIYWANLQYVSGNWNQFTYGRLRGPESAGGGHIYRDQNAFAMLFVAGIPFVYYLGLHFKSIIPRLCSLGIVILGWHAIFLTGSRGGLLGLCATVLVIVLKSRRKYLSMLILPVFAVFFALQGGQTMKNRANSIESAAVEDRSAEMRITAWKGGTRMILNHPITGVGVGSFITALPHFIEASPRVAHNTLIQFTAESGVVAGFSYIAIVVLFFTNSMRIGKIAENLSFSSGSSRYLNAINNASTAAFAGLIVCSVFLSLNNYEMFYFLILCSNSLMVVSSRQLGHAN